jgi:hypothetical protein
MHVAMFSQSGRDINPGVDEGDFMTGQSMGPPTSLLVCCIFIQYVILPEGLRSPLAVNLVCLHSVIVWHVFHDCNCGKSDII